MPVWKRAIVGDAFRLSVNDWNYYRDLLLFFPLFFSAMGFISGFIWKPETSRLTMGSFLAIALLCVALAKDRLVLLALVPGCCAAWSGLQFLATRDWRSLVWAIASAIFFSRSWFQW